MKTVRFLMRSIRENKRNTILSVLFVTLEVVCECALPFVMAKLIDNSGVDWSSLLLYGAILIVLASGALACGILSGRASARAAAGFCANLRKDMFVKVQNYSFSNIDKYSESGLVTRMTTDVTNIQNAFSMIIRVAARVPLMIIFSAVMAFIISPLPAWIFVLCIPVLGGVIVFIICKSLPYMMRVFKKYDKLNESVHENVKAIRVVKTYVREDYENKKFAGAADDVCNDFVKGEKNIAWNTPVMSFFMYACFILISVLGAYIITGQLGWGALTTGGLSSLISYGINILSALMMLSMIVVIIAMSAASAKRIEEVLREESDLVSPANGLTAVADGSVDFDGVSFRYSEGAEKYVLENIDLHIKSGETVGILGGTGSSKTSLVNLISRLYDVSEGSIKVGGVDVREYDLDTLRQNVAVVLQKNVLFSGTVKENLCWGDKEATDEEVYSAARTANAYDFITKLPEGFNTMLTSDGANLSQGQRQLLSIARAAIADTPLLIMDEATSSIDTRTEKIVQQGTDKLMEGRTTFVIAHRLSTVQSSDDIIVLDHGTIIEEGSHDELIAAKGQYYRLYTGAFELE